MIAAANTGVRQTGRRWLSLAAAACLLSLLSGCGFQLRGQVSLPFETLYVPANSPLAVELKRSIAAGTQTKLVDTPELAQARLVFQQDTREKVILSLDTAGRVREYQLRSKVAFRVVDSRGLQYLTLNDILLTRDVSFNDAQVLAKESEEALLYRDMQTDMVQQILRRLGSARTPEGAAPVPAAPGDTKKP
jgi:LPS-assembly lipoprotein